jgi:hypothetical protein
MIFMVFSKLRAPDDQRLSPLFPDEYDRDLLGLCIHVEQNAIFAEKSQLALSDRIGTQGLHLFCFSHGIGRQPLLGLGEQEPPVLAPKPTQIG